MVSRPSGEGPGDAAGEDGQSVRLTDENTFPFLPGQTTGVACPCCFRDQLLGEVIRSGTCNGCDTELEVTLSANCTPE